MGPRRPYRAAAACSTAGLGVGSTGGLMSPQIPRRVVMALCAAMLGMCASTLQQTLLATATPTIIAELGHPDAYAWVMGANLLASTLVLPWAGVVTDRIGARPMYLAGMGLFTLATILVCLSHAMGVLLVFRMLQGVGAGLLVPAALSVVGLLDTDRLRGRVFGLMGLAQVLANVAGPLWGGWSTENIGWRWGMAATTSFAVIGWLLSSVSMPTADRPAGWWRVRRSDLALRSATPGLTGMLAMAFLIGGITVPVVTFLPWALQAVHYLDASAIGHRLLPMLLASAVGSVLGGTLASGSRTLTGCWLVLLTASLTAARGDVTALTLGAAGIGLGCGAALTVVLTRAQTLAGTGQVAGVSALVQLARHAGAAFFVPLLGLWPAQTPASIACTGLLLSFAVAAFGGLVISWRIT
ncbi:TPA: MFS transporter [Corynebacterium striatum]|nr:MFS transporter [Corynebacterium striatum]NHY35180.1 MFS transporter [Corynebacterium striatum]HAT6405430.1 MFS transporter [Corynebacterium striatum]HAT6418450.1 MFS transporter [Corynebacterium striatum]HAT6433185.1 MFS transporter [Corynebacterium striatum]